MRRWSWRARFSDRCTKAGADRGRGQDVGGRGPASDERRRGDLRDESHARASAGDGEAFSRRDDAVRSFPQRLAELDVVITSSAAPEHVLTRETVRRALEARKHQPIFLIDIAVPRNIDPAVQESRARLSLRHRRSQAPGGPQPGGAARRRVSRPRRSLPKRSKGSKQSSANAKWVR